MRAEVEAKMSVLQGAPSHGGGDDQATSAHSAASDGATGCVPSDKSVRAQRRKWPVPTARASGLEASLISLLGVPSPVECVAVKG